MRFCVGRHLPDIEKFQVYDLYKSREASHTSDFARVENAVTLAAPGAYTVRHLGLPQHVVPILRPNIQQRLIRATLDIPIPRPPGCWQCGTPNCRTCQWLTLGNHIISMHTGLRFNVRGHITCNSPHAIYVVSCNRCGMQGVGETFDVRQRIQSYAIAVARAPSNATAIHRHFSTGHYPDDFSMMLVDSIPFRLGTSRATRRTVSIRLEQRWIQNLTARLNKKRQLHSSFLGYDPDFADADLDDVVLTT